MSINLNDLLQFSDEELKRVKIKFNMPTKYSNPLILYLDNPDEINTNWFLWRNKSHYYRVGEIAICFVRIDYDTWLLTTIKEIIGDKGLQDCVNYEGVEVEKYKKFFGRVVIKYHNTLRGVVNYFTTVGDKLEILQILPTLYDGREFPGYDKVCLSYKELEIIVNRNKEDWVSALENQKAVYLITDTKNGKHYVGSATSETGMLLSRWRSYISNGHGGNKELVSLVENKGFDYVKENFQYSILENYNSREDDKKILEREGWWKEALKSREFGYNAN